MDSGGKVVIERAPIPADRIIFWAIQLRVCTLSPTYLQIWRQVQPGVQAMAFKLEWQTLYVATMGQINEIKWTTVSLLHPHYNYIYTHNYFLLKQIQTQVMRFNFGPIASLQHQLF